MFDPPHLAPWPAPAVGEPVLKGRQHRGLVELAERALQFLFDMQRQRRPYGVREVQHHQAAFAWYRKQPFEIAATSRCWTSGVNFTGHLRRAERWRGSDPNDQ